MPHHSAYAMSFEDLDVMIIDDSKAQQAIYRTVFSGLRNARTRVFGDGEHAMASLMNEPPDVIVLDWYMKPMSGSKFLKTLRSAQLEPLSFIPVIVVSAHGTERNVQQAFKAGANAFLLKPISPVSISNRIRWLLEDDRKLVRHAGQYVINGVDKKLEEHNEKTRGMLQARAHHLKAKQSNDTKELLRTQAELNALQDLFTSKGTKTAAPKQSATPNNENKARPKIPPSEQKKMMPPRKGGFARVTN